ncbi:hypothetical protein LENED_012148 [Lentinula edodes]|uniref:Uncharacterized protein n=1 Tax=Lentinula edodes TaxID=5353 RepID=A0A1Q3ERV5_LENED|nr:hypothetical protein LENED_012148 [Lentinula edodes]
MRRKATPWRKGARVYYGIWLKESESGQQWEEQFEDIWESYGQASGVTDSVAGRMGRFANLDPDDVPDYLI